MITKLRLIPMEDFIWELVAKKIANEASADELSKLDEMLKHHPDIDYEVRLVLEWWKADMETEKEDNSQLLFAKVMRSIGILNENGQSEKSTKKIN